MIPYPDGNFAIFRNIACQNERMTDRQRQRQTDRDIQIDRQRQRHTDRHRQIHAKTGRLTDRDRHRQADRDIGVLEGWGGGGGAGHCTFQRVFSQPNDTMTAVDHVSDRRVDCKHTKVHLIKIRSWRL